jgi:2-polyprenyl-3-methyl-5-hydroxy-6-metoxy-1,4-benzoquinol methylase
MARADMIAFGKKTYGLDLRVSTLEACTLEPGQFDVVSLWGTDSHFFDVREGFQKLTDWLKPGGHLLFSYQDYTVAAPPLSRGISEPLIGNGHLECRRGPISPEQRLASIS